MIAPQYNREGIKLYLSECLEVLKQLPDNSADATVTDPPFGINFKYDKHEDKATSYEGGYGAWLWSIISECERICKPGSPIFVWQGMPNCRYFSEWFPRDYRIFAAVKNSVTYFPEAMQHSYDPVIVWWKEGGARYSTWKNSTARYINADEKSGRSCQDWHLANSAVAKFNSPGSLERDHPCPRPLDQVEYIIRNWVRPMGVLLDPFLGAGTMAVACYRNNRQCIGVEKNQDYLNIAIKRVNSVMGGNALADMKKQAYQKRRKLSKQKAKSPSEGPSNG